MQKKSYKEFAQIYDLLMNDIDYEKWLSFIINKIGKDKNILEAACGTGSITCMLCDYIVTAFDLSEDMLMKAYEKVGRAKNIKLLNLDMKKFKIDNKFDVALCCCDGVNYLNKSEIELFFKNIYDHLSLNGKFIFDISTEFKYNNMYNDTYVYENEDIFYVWENNLNKDDHSVDIEINFFINQELDNYKRITEEQTQYIHTIQEIVHKLKNIGFNTIEIYDDYNNDKVNENSIRAVFSCIKR